MNTTVDTESAYRGTIQERVLFLDSLRALAIIMVIGVHSIGYSHPLPSNEIAVISFIIQSVAVPVFFLVDGYLFAMKTISNKESPYLKYVKKNFFRLLVPWLIFTLIYSFARYCFELLDFLDTKLIIGHSFQDVAISAYGSVYAPQMYFLFSLFLIRLCSPIFKRIITIKNYVLLLLLFIFYFAIYKSNIQYISPHLRIDGGQEPLQHALWGIQYYFIGIILFKTSIIIDIKKLFIPFLLLFIFTLIFIGPFGKIEFVISQYLYLITLFLLFVFIGKQIPFLNMIGKNTMGLYLIHAPIVLKGVSLLLNKLIDVPVWNFISVYTVTFFISLGIVITINAIPYGNLLFGTTHKK